MKKKKRYKKSNNDRIFLAKPKKKISKVFSTRFLIQPSDKEMAYSREKASFSDMLINEFGDIAVSSKYRITVEVA